MAPVSLPTSTLKAPIGSSTAPSRRAGRRSIVALLSVLVMVVALAAPAGAAPKAKHEPTLVSREAAPVVAGVPTWVNVLWVADGSIDEFTVTASVKDVEVAYSPTTGDHAGPMNGYALDHLETDFTALRLTVPEDYSKKDVKVTLVASWTRPDGKSMTKKFRVWAPVVHFDGDRDWQLVDDEASLGTGWVEVPVFGLAPSSDDLRFTLADSDGVDVYLPQSDWTGPHHDSNLAAGESDVLRFFVEPSTVSADHTFVFDATWARTGTPKAEAVSFTVRAG